MVGKFVEVGIGLRAQFFGPRRLVESMSENGNFVRRLADLFRGVSLVFGISAPPPEQDQRQFVILWLGIITVTILFFVGVFFALSHFHVG